MINFLHNVLTLFKKEILMIWKDPRNRTILIVPVLVQTLVFGYVASYDLNRVDYALLDEDGSISSRELVAHFDGSPIFHRAATLGNTSQIAPMLDEKKVQMIIHIGPSFEKKLEAGQSAPVQVEVDGRNGNVAGIASGYASSIIDSFNRARVAARGETVPVLNISTRSWFNPNLETRWNFISGMVVVLTMVQVTLLTALSVSREKEQGTFDQLLVTPFSPMVILLGKSLPSVLIGVFQSTLVLLIALYWFHIEFMGSYVLLYAGLLILYLAMVGIGLFISTLTSTMQQSMLYCFCVIMITMLLSGFMTPISSMPEIIQYATYANPLRYGVEIAQRIYLEGSGWEELHSSYLILVLISLLTLGPASRLFRKGI